MAYFPFFVDISGQECLIAGGGMVAYRKALTMKDYDPHITVIAPYFIPEMKQLAGECNGTIVLLQRNIMDSDLNQADFVIAATSEEKINRHLSQCCRERKIPVNVVDAQEECSFIFPALIREKDITIGISTGGNSPTVARYLKEKIKDLIPSGFGSLVSQLGSYRNMIKENIESQLVRSEIFKIMVDEGIRCGGVFSQEQLKELIERLREEHEQ